MRSQTVLDGHAPPKLRGAGLSAIAGQLEELKAIGPEWDGPGAVSPGPDVIDHAAAWLAEHWRSDLGIPDICPTSDGGVSISWQWGDIEHSIDVRADGASMEWCQYNPDSLQTMETELPLDRRGWNTILAGLSDTDCTIGRT